MRPWQRHCRPFCGGDGVSSCSWWWSYVWALTAVAAQRLTQSGGSRAAYLITYLRKYHDSSWQSWPRRMDGPTSRGARRHKDDRVGSGNDLNNREFRAIRLAKEYCDVAHKLSDKCICGISKHKITCCLGLQWFSKLNITGKSDVLNALSAIASSTSLAIIPGTIV